jgi:hypothetical protein
LSKLAEKRYRDKVQGKSVINPDIGRINFNYKGIDETINKSKYNPDVLKATTKIMDIIRKGKDAGETNKKIRKDKASFIGLEHDIKIKNKIKTALALVRKQPNVLQDFYALYLMDKKQKN